VDLLSLALRIGASEPDQALGEHSFRSRQAHWPTAFLARHGRAPMSFASCTASRGRTRGLRIARVCHAGQVGHPVDRSRETRPVGGGSCLPVAIPAIPTAVATHAAVCRRCGERSGSGAAGAPNRLSLATRNAPAVACIRKLGPDGSGFSAVQEFLNLDPRRGDRVSCS
jgi:hypothetical protein